MYLKAGIFVRGLPGGNKAALKMYEEIQKYVSVCKYES